MTLRTRLGGAFLIAVAGPVLLGGITVSIAAGSVNRSRSAERLDVAATALRTAVGATCDRLQVAVEAAARLTLGGTQPAAARAVVSQGAASAVRVDGASGATLLSTPGAPPLPWTLCGHVPGASVGGDGAPGALAAAVAVRGPAGGNVGYVYAAQALDANYVRGLSHAVGANLTLRSNPAVSTETAATARAVSGRIPREAGPVDGRYVRAVVPIAGQPLDFVLSVPATGVRDIAVIASVAAALAAVAAAGGVWAVGRGTLRQIVELTRAADRVAAGDLRTRVPVRRRDEIGWLGIAFNRMVRETQSYVDALTASRDQLRGNLNLLGDTLSSTHDLPGMMRVMLASAMTATAAGRGAVLLVDRGTGNLGVRCSAGFDAYVAAELEAVTLSWGAGLLGSVAATGVARCGRMTTADPPLAPGEPRCVNYLAVPLPSPVADGTHRRPPARSDAAGGAVGVLVLYDRTGGDFTEADLRNVRTFAGHAAVAVDNVRVHDEAQRLSHTDSLTGLYNYRHLQEMLAREVSRSTRFGHPLSVMVLDLDHFKQVNDSYGHAAGDAVLAEFARRISREIRGVDLAFRAGGEEFVILLPETAGPGAEVLAQRLGAAVRTEATIVPDAFRATAELKTVEMPLVRPAADEPLAGSRSDRTRGSAAVPARYTVRVPITVSIGVAVFPEHGATGPDVLAAADSALYDVKAAGRDGYRVAGAPTPGPTGSGEQPVPAGEQAGTPPEPKGTAPAEAITAPDPAAAGGVRPRRGHDDPQPSGADGAPTAGPPPRPPTDG